MGLGCWRSRRGERLILPKTSQKDIVKLWQSRVTAAWKCKEKWSDKYLCDHLENYYLGHQWADEPEDIAQRKYVINLCFPSMEIKIPSLMFYRPQVQVTPRPTRVDDQASMAEARAKLQEDTLNSLIDDEERTGFKRETTLALKEGFSRFGVVEVGYSADFIDNPNKGKPVLKEDEHTPVTDSSGQQVMQPDQILQEEWLYVKRIPGKRFVVGANGKNALGHNDWYGYFEWHNVEDVKRNPRYSNTSGIKSTGSMSSDYAEETGNKEDNELQRGMAKLWKVWDLRSRTKIVFLEGHDKFLLQEPFKYICHAVLKFHEILDEFYPLPPMFNWIHPQNELNETREMQRIHRKRFYRRYGHIAGVDADQLKKLEDGGDGVYVELPNKDAIWPVPDAPLDPAIVRNIPLTKEDFQQISGITGEERGVSESDTATQANIIDVRSRIRENYSRSQVAAWLAQVCRIMLLTCKDKMQLPFWIKRNVDPQGPAAEMEALAVAAVWQQIQAEDLGDTNCDVTVDIESLSPLTEDAKRQSWERVLGIITTQPHLTLSPVLLRKTLSYYDIKSEREIAELQKWGQMMLAMQAAAAAQTVKSGSAPKGNTAPAGTGGPSSEEIANQLTQQTGMVQ